MRTSRPRYLTAALLFLAFGGARAAPATTAASPALPVPTIAQAGAAAAAPSEAFSQEELDQMMAPLALYPDSLLAQVLMASTYPGDVADAVAWSKAHKDAKGEEAVRQVANESWDPSVQSLVAFPQLLAVLGQDPKWVQRMGDAFLAQPEAVMDSVQRLRRQAQAAGNLETNEQQKVTTQSAPPAAAGSATTTAQPASQTIIIEPADPEVVYVPSYPSSVYGSWAYPSYPPYYYPPPPYYYPGGALLGFGIGIAVGGALWGDFNWGGGDIDIDVNRYNNINTNRQINRNENTFRHNAANRDGVPYRDRASREQYGRQLDGAGQRGNYRGRDTARAADRERARQSLSQRGIETPAASNREARDRAGQASREMGQRPAQSNAQARQGARDGYAGTRTAQNNNAFAGARDPGQSRASANRGRGSYSASQRPSSARSAGRSMQRPSRPPMRGGGGRRR